MARPQLSALLEPRGHQENPDRLRAVRTSEAPEAEPATAAPAVPDAAEPAIEAEPAPTAEKPKAAAPKPAAGKRPRRSPAPRAAAPTAPEAVQNLPPYLRFERKESRLRPDQLTQLSTRARQLNKARHAEADRITDNTLIRVAVDLLLSRADELAGGDEDGLRRSLGLTSEV
ncbi:MAG: hypothetical protein KF727_15320 [Microbacteriaceae bacterium]|nr:hypothetical protein [Microbacteriaceae bacterium]